MDQARSAQLYARAAGAFYLIEIALAFAVNPVWAKLAVAGSVTVQQIAAPLSPWRLALTGELLGYVCYAVVAVMLYGLLRPVSSVLALLSTLLMLTHVAIGAASELGRSAALQLLGGAPSTAALEPRLANAMATLALSLHDDGHDVALAFFAAHCIVLGYLIYRSHYLPKAFGVLFVVASLCLATSIATAILAPAVNAQIFPAIVLPFFLTQLTFALWLVVKGVNAGKWPGGEALGAAG
jgi:uncharacterized protein DUF4386